MAARRYVPDLRAQMADSEANFLRLMKLLPKLEDLPKLEEESCFEFQLDREDGQVEVRMTVTERFRYTSTLHIEQRSATGWLQFPELLVRVYHDARLAEVVESGRRQLEGRYAYPNARMQQPDEKAQLNRFLAEWLSQCLARGRSLTDIALV